MTSRTMVWLTCLLVTVCAPKPSQAALQPLDVFLTAASQFNHDLRGAKAADGQKHADVATARGKLLPGLDVTGSYTRNEFAVKFPFGPNGKELTIMPHDQLEAAATLIVPLIDIGNWARFHASRDLAEVARAGLEQSALTVAAQVTMRYYALLGQEGLHQAALERETVAQDNLSYVSSKAEVGSSSSLDVARAKSDVAQAQQDVANALLQVRLSRRALQTLTGVEPDAGGALGQVPLIQETPLPQWLSRVGTALPPVRQAAAQQRAARAGSRAAKWGYLPTLSAKGVERFTNASGLNGGHPHVWMVQANLAWHFDLALPAIEAAQKCVFMGAKENEASAIQAAADHIYQDYVQIEANLTKSAAARAQVEATRLGAEWAREKYAAGTVTQLEVSQSQRDAFAAEAARIQADTDLLYYRALLRLDAGMAPERLEETP